ncbi:universal stress protein [Salarchaeum japonicum]|uniref:universal stress protein n=1 Tax=Salarchaeum japonicum TaxID=555573 RepID=UPI003C72A822
MGLYDRVLVPTDGSAETRRAVEHAVSLAAEHDATLHAVYVVNTATFASLGAETTTEGVSDLLADEGEDALDAVAEVASEAGVPVERVLLNGTPSREIVRYAEDNDIDLIVMGTHGRGGIDRLLLGSVAEKVVRSSQVPVLTVRVAD